MKISRYPIAIVATLAASSLLLTACGGGSDDDDAKGKKETPKTTAVDVKATDPVKLKQGGTLSWALSGLPTQWNGLEADGADANASSVLRALMPSFWHSQADGTQVPNEAFLLDAQSEMVDGKQVVTWQLNPKAKWSDGTPITWKDLAANVKAMDGKDESFQVSSTTGYDQVESVKKGKDEYEAIMTFATPFADWQAMFSAPANGPLYPAKYMADAKKFNEGYVGKIPITGNAFKLDKIDKTAQTVTVVPDPNWWGDKPKLDKIVFRAMEASGMPAAYANGEVNYFEIAGDPSAYKQASKVKRGEIRKAGGPNYRIFSFNGESKQLSDVRVRQAIFMAINRKTMAESNLKGLGWDATPLDNHYLVANQDGYKDNSGKLGKFDPEAAGKLLDEAGWKLDGKLRKKDGKFLEVRFVIPAGIAGAINEGSMLTEMLGDVGIKVDVQSVPANDFFTKYLAKGDFDITPFSLIGTPFPASGSLNVYGTKGGTNFGKIGTKELDELINKAAQATDPVEGQKLINEADAETWKLAGILPIYQRPDIVAIDKNIANLGALGLTDPIYEHIGFLK
ncbi:ABC transporter family substrate-binding protein [Streptomyces sp. TP-A0874]|uniref:ABC transporter family substrate-binding protein n=1 Tax=Streptomyces sp. TP-A0874 TaxID=549819 RepID=UPI000AE2C51A|nr:ABC transporter family substrate-binding protein [Streptomyces sp. TP-A0874]